MQNLNILTVVVWAISLVAMIVLTVMGLPVPAELKLLVEGACMTILALLGAAFSKKKEEPKSEG